MLTNTYHFTILIIALLLIIYIIYKLKCKKPVIVNNLNKIENFTTDSNAKKEVEKLLAKYNGFSNMYNNFGNIQSVKDKFTNMPLHQYCIKSSYNTACSGKYVSSDMIEHIISRGCRFLDFEVFYIKNNNIFMPKVAVSTDHNFIILDTHNSISLDEALSTVATTAFSQKSPNNNDPIFINLRIKSKDSNVYEAVAKSLDSNLKSIAYTGNITEQTKLKDIMRKAIVVVDKTIQRDYKDYANCASGDVKCYDISNYTNLESGSEYLNLFHYTDLLNHSNQPALIKDDNIHTTAENMKMAIPDIIPNTSNPVYKEFVVKHACQNLFVQYPIVDKPLNVYEDFFNDMMGGIVPLSVALTYFAKKK